MSSFQADNIGYTLSSFLHLESSPEPSQWRFHNKTNMHWSETESGPPPVKSQRLAWTITLQCKFIIFPISVCDEVHSLHKAATSLALMLHATPKSLPIEYGVVTFLEIFQHRPYLEISNRMNVQKRLNRFNLWNVLLKSFQGFDTVVGSLVLKSTNIQEVLRQVENKDCVQ